MDGALSNTKKKILEAALALFQQKGYDNVSITEICEVAGVSVSTFYYQFTNKNILFNHLSHRDITLTPKTTAKILIGESPFEKIWLLHSSYAKLGEQLGPELYGQLLKNRITQHLGYENDEDFEYTVALAAHLIKLAQELGEIRNTAPANILAETITHLLIGLSHIWCVENGAFSLQKKMRQDVEAFYDLRPDLREEL